MAQVMVPTTTAITTTAAMTEADETQATSGDYSIPHATSTLRSRPQPRNRLPERAHSYADNRTSSYSKRSNASSHSRPHSNVFPAFQSSLPYAQVRDFAYPTFSPMHYGAPPEASSGPSTPGLDWYAGRRSSDSAEGSAAGGGSMNRAMWGAGPWADGGALYGDPDQDMEPLPSTSFGSVDDLLEDETSLKKSRHRKSRSFADNPSYERGRRRESANRNSDSVFSGSNYDPAGRGALRHSRGIEENGEFRRDSHFATTLPSRSFHTSQTVDPDEEIPLDAEPSRLSPQRASIGPDDEELFAGPSLALYSFEPENDNELRLTEGQTILVSYRHGQGWLVAENPQTGEQGLVPEQYVRLLRDIDGWDEERGGFVDDEELLDVEENGLDHQSSPETERVPGNPAVGNYRLDHDVDMKDAHAE